MPISREEYMNRLEILRKGQGIEPTPPLQPAEGMMPAPLQTIDDFARSAADAASFGLLDKAIQSMTGVNEPLKTEIARHRSPRAALGGEVAGTVLPAEGIGGALKAAGRAIPGLSFLARPTIPAIAAREALTGGGLSAGKDVAAGRPIDPMKAAGSALTAGIVGPTIASGMRLAPELAIRTAGSGITGAEREAATGAVNRAGRVGVPISVPEAVTTVAPGKAGRLQAMYSQGMGSPVGSARARDFADRQLAALREAGRNVSTQLGPPASVSQVANYARAQMGRQGAGSAQATVLGGLAKAKAPTQGKALFSSTTAQDAKAVDKVMQRMPAGTPRGVLANAIESEASKGKPAYHKLIPSDVAAGTARTAAGSQAQSVDDLLEASKMASVKTPRPMVEDPWAGGAMVGLARKLVGNARSARAVRLLQDPNMIRKLGLLGPWQIPLDVGTSLSTVAARNKIGRM